jgi:uncharacterized protein
MNKPTLIFANLPVKDLKKSTEFYTKLGFSVNPKFSDEKATCIVISETIFVMLLTEPFFKSFISKSVADSKSVTEVLLSISTESREAVDILVNKALNAGGTKARDPEDHGFMYGWSFQDPDGHIWEPFWMDENHGQNSPDN